LKNKIDSILEDLNSNQELKADTLIEYADSFIEVPNEIASAPYPESHKIPACESEAYAFYKVNSDQTIKFYFAVTNPQGISAKAFAVILDEGFSNQNLNDIINSDPDIVKKVFGNSVSMGKGLGLNSMLGVVKTIAQNNLNKTETET